jgi:hypothetical protein
MSDIIESLRYALSEQDAAKVLHIANEIVQQYDEGLIKVLPENTLETIKLLTITSICYQKINDMILDRLRDSEDISDLFLHIPTVQYTANHLKLMRLAESEIDVNRIKSIDEVVNILYPRAEAEKALRESNVP